MLSILATILFLIAIVCTGQVLALSRKVRRLQELIYRIGHKAAREQLADTW
ncbi:MAG: hypothetical protein HY978_04950 [Candidatus Liptonbacteria bacterium]|nr:hypothetical protein [Candidatus Liptonbacteria bacterium]